MIAVLSLLLVPGPMVPLLYTNTYTGTVKVETRECITAPCPSPVWIYAAGNKLGVQVTGPMADDLAAYNGKVVTVKGVQSTHPELGAPMHQDFQVESFAPGRNGDIVTGVVHEYCLGAGGTGNGCQAFIKVGQRTLKIDQSQYLKGIGALSGQTVTLYGTYKNAGVGGGGSLTFEPSSDKVSVKGNLGELYFAQPRIEPIVPHVGNWELSFKNGEKIVVDSKLNITDRNNTNVWVTGTLVQGGGDLATYLKATSVSGTVYGNGDGNANGNPLFGEANAGTGSNVGRNDATTGATTQAAAQNEGANGGFHH